MIDGMPSATDLCSMYAWPGLWHAAVQIRIDSVVVAEWRLLVRSYWIAAAVLYSLPDLYWDLSFRPLQRTIYHHCIHTKPILSSL